MLLRWSDLNMGRKVVRVQPRQDVQGSERDGTKTNQVRDVDLTPGAWRRCKSCGLSRPRFTQDDESGEAPDIFQHPVTERPWRQRRSQRDTYWRPSLKRCVIRWRSAYSTRHTFATIALMAGIVQPTSLEATGHSVQMLLERYALDRADNWRTTKAPGAAMPQISPGFPQSLEAA